VATRQEGTAGFIEMVVDIDHVRIAYRDRHLEKTDRVRIEVEIPVRIVGLLAFDDAANYVDAVFFFAGQDSQCLVDFVLIGQLKGELLPGLLSKSKLTWIGHVILLAIFR